MSKPKRTVRVDVRMTPAELAAIKKAALDRWPGMYRPLSLSNTVRCLALIATKPGLRTGT